MNAATSLSLIGMVLLFAVAVGGVIWVFIQDRQRRAVLERASGDAPASVEVFRRPQATAGRSAADRVADWLGARVPLEFGNTTELGSKLVQAGFEGPAAGVLFNVIRLASAITIPVLGLLVAPRDDATYFIFSMVIATFIGLFGPQAALDSLISRRQDTIRKGVPDALDLLVVCVEAGVALDAAIQRVSREMRMLHPILADELSGMSRRVSAGMPREQALQGLYIRTGLDELRGLASHMLQSEKWGTSIAGVLRVYADQLRKKRKMAAEKRAATASTRMLIPLALFIFPTIFIVLLGPAGIQISEMFDNMR